jgi:thiamine-phosphate pyrophosphorylase
LIPAAGLPHICLITDGSERDLAVIAGLVAAGARWFQLRAKAVSDREFFARAVRLRERLDGSDALLTVNDRADVAIASGAAGLHLGQDDLRVEDARRLLPKACIGVSVHDGAEAAAAAAADYVGTGALFPSATKQDARPLTRERLRAVQAAYPGPVVGIGGITAANVAQLAALGIRHLAVASAVFAAADPVAAFRSLATQLPPQRAAGAEGD